MMRAALPLIVFAFYSYFSFPYMQLRIYLTFCTIQSVTEEIITISSATPVLLRQYMLPTVPSLYFWDGILSESGIDVGNDGEGINPAHLLYFGISIGDHIDAGRSSCGA